MQAVFQRPPSSAPGLFYILILAIRDGLVLQHSFRLEVSLPLLNYPDGRNCSSRHEYECRTLFIRILLEAMGLQAVLTHLGLGEDMQLGLRTR